MLRIHRIQQILIFILTAFTAQNGYAQEAETPLFRFHAQTTYINEFSAELNLTLVLTFSDPKATIEVQLTNPQDELIHEEVVKSRFIDNWIQQSDISIPIQNPEYWNAEQPSLYQLNFKVNRSNDEAIVEQCQIGLVEYSVEKNKITCNQTPIVIQGVQYSIDHPDRNRPFTRDQYREDLQLMQQMHFNAVRVLGEPPSEDFIQLCDEIGMYVLIDVHETYTAPTIHAYQNHPSVLVWNLDVRKMDEEKIQSTIGRVKQIDRSHPLLLQYDSIQDAPPLGDGLLISDPPRNEWRFLGASKQPTLACNLFPAMDYALEGLSDFFAMARANASLRGGFLQQFADLSSVEKVKPITQPLLNDRKAQQQGSFGHDGLVNADRTLQPDFWQARQALDYIEIQENEVIFREGRSIELTAMNHYAFTNLNQYKAFWYISENSNVIEQGELSVHLPPQRSMKIAVRPQTAKPNPDANTYLTIHFYDDERIVSEHSAWLKPKDFEQNFTMRLRDLTWDEDWTVTTDIEESRIDHEDFIFHTQTGNCAWFLLAREDNMRLISEGPFIHLNRKLTPYEQLHTTQSGYDQPCEIINEPLRVLERQVDRRGPDIEIKTRVSSSISHCSTEIEAQIDLLSSPYGFCDVRFTFDQIETSQAITEAGISFLVPSTLDRVGWLGDGPFPSFPGMEQLSMPGFFNLTPVSSILPGNRRNIQALVLANEDGFGVGVLTWNGDVSIYPASNGTLVYINSAISGKGGVSDPSRYSINSRNLTKLKPNKFRIIPIVKNKVPGFFHPWIKK